MSTSMATAGNPGVVRGLWQRQIPRYPDTVRRYTYLGIIVLATIVLYYELYIGGAVPPSILHQYDISFASYVLILVFANALAAVPSLTPGLPHPPRRATI